MKSFFNALLITSAFLINNVIANENIEEVIVTGTLLKNAEQDSSPVDVISESDYRNLNISNIAEISKYISSSSGSHFQAHCQEEHRYRWHLWSAHQTLIETGWHLLGPTPI